MTLLLLIRHGLAEDYRLGHPHSEREDASFLAAHRRRAAYEAWKVAGKP